MPNSNTQNNIFREPKSLFGVEDIYSFDPHPNNDMELNSEDYQKRIRSLADDIEENGLIVPISIIVNPKNDKRFLIVEGHRRCEALKFLVEKRGLEKFRSVRSFYFRILSYEESVLYIISDNEKDREKTIFQKFVESRYITSAIEVMRDKKIRSVHQRRTNEILADTLHIGDKQAYILIRIARDFDHYLTTQFRLGYLNLAMINVMLSFSKSDFYDIARQMEEDSYFHCSSKNRNTKYINEKTKANFKSIVAPPRKEYPPRTTEVRLNSQGKITQLKIRESALRSMRKLRSDIDCNLLDDEASLVKLDKVIKYIKSHL